MRQAFDTRLRCHRCKAATGNSLSACSSGLSRVADLTQPVLLTRVALFPRLLVCLHVWIHPPNQELCLHHVRLLQQDESLNMIGKLLPKAVDSVCTSRRQFN